MNHNKLFIASFILNILVFLLVVTGVILMFTVSAGALGIIGWTVFKYFTFQSNIFVGAVCLVYAILQFLIIKGKLSKLPPVLLVFNHVAITAVSLTFLVTIVFLIPIYGADKLYVGANLFFHALVPLTAMINYFFIEKEAKIKFWHTVFAVSPCLLYGIVYFTVVVSLNGYGNLDIDFYGFGKYGAGIGVLYLFILVAVSYCIGLFLYFINQLVFKKRR